MITKVTHINTKQDLSRWTREHTYAPGITWSVKAGDGGTMIIVEHTEDRCTRRADDATRQMEVAA